MRGKTEPRHSHPFSPAMRSRLIHLAVDLCVSLMLWDAAAGQHSVALAGVAAHPLGRCKGSTRAHVHPAWPGPAQRVVVEALHWGARVDLFQHGSLPAWRTARYRAALADLIAYVHRVCSSPALARG